MISNLRTFTLSTFVVALLLCVTLPIDGQAQVRRSNEDASLVVDGRVQNVFRSGDECLVQILVQGSEVPRLESIGSTRYPAPGEYVYVHLSVPASPRGRVTRPFDTRALPERQTRIRAFLSVGERQSWEANGPSWFEELSDIDRSRPRNEQITGTEERGTPSLGIVSERISLRSGNALKVVRVAPQSPAARAGIEAGDVLVKANSLSLASPEQLAAAFRRSNGQLTLTVRDVRSGRDVLVDIPSEAESRDAGVAVTPGRNRTTKPLGVKTELAFYEGEAAVKVTEVEPDSPAQRAGIVPGLLILAANGDRILHPDRLLEAERTAKGTLKLEVVNPRDRRKRVVQVDL